MFGHALGQAMPHADHIQKKMKADLPKQWTVQRTVCRSVFGQPTSTKFRMGIVELGFRSPSVKRPILDAIEQFSLRPIQFFELAKDAPKFIPWRS